MKNPNNEVTMKLRLSLCALLSLSIAQQSFAMDKKRDATKAELPSEGPVEKKARTERYTFADKEARVVEAIGDQAKIGLILEQAIQDNDAENVELALHYGHVLPNPTFNRIIRHNCAPKIMTLLLKYGFDCNYLNDNGDCPIHMFAKHNAPALKAMLDEDGIYGQANNPFGIKINAKNGNGRTALELAMLNQNTQAIKILANIPEIELPSRGSSSCPPSS